MKFPKHRANCFVVERIVDNAYCVVGVFPTHEGAVEFAGACEQAFVDKDIDKERYTFGVVMSTYYDC
jgi:hypothetical protein